MLGEKVTYIEADYSELDELIKKEYGHDFDFCLDQEALNDSTYTFRVNDRIDKYDERNIKKFVETGDGTMLTHSLLNDLCRQGKIEAGDYIITVCW